MEGAIRNIFFKQDIEAFEKVYTISNWKFLFSDSSFQSFYFYWTYFQFCFFVVSYFYKNKRDMLEGEKKKNDKNFAYR